MDKTEITVAREFLRFLNQHRGTWYPCLRCEAFVMRSEITDYGLCENCAGEVNDAPNP